jgi:hypothetical protein
LCCIKKKKKKKEKEKEEEEGYIPKSNKENDAENLY